MSEVSQDGTKSECGKAWAVWCKEIDETGKPRWIAVADGDTAFLFRAFERGWEAALSLLEPSPAEEPLERCNFRWHDDFSEELRYCPYPREYHSPLRWRGRATPSHAFVSPSPAPQVTQAGIPPLVVERLRGAFDCISGDGKSIEWSRGYADAFQKVLRYLSGFTFPDGYMDGDDRLADIRAGIAALGATQPEEPAP